MNPRLEKSRNIFQLWEDGDGDMTELAIGLYDLTAHYEVLLEDHEALEAKLEVMEAFVSAVWLSGDQMTLKSLREDETWRPALESLTAVIADETSAV